jgi:3-methyladenine DNA glycosylase AlkD
MASRTRYLKEVEDSIRRHQSSATVRKFIARYVGGVDHEARKPDEQSRLKYHGLKVPLQRKIFNKGFSFVKSASEFKVWSDIFKSSDVFEAKTMALLFLRQQRDNLEHDLWPALKEWVIHVDNWAHSDELSYFYAILLEKNYKKFKPVFEQMNKSKNPWLRRQSVVGLLNYSRMRKKYPPTPWMLKQIHNLLNDPHIYVQKGVGWALREIHNIDPKLQEAFIIKHLNKISPTAWYAATENYSATAKKKLVELRKKARAKKSKSNE